MALGLQFRGMAGVPSSATFEIQHAFPNSTNYERDNLAHPIPDDQEPEFVYLRSELWLCVRPSSSKP